MLAIGVRFSWCLLVLVLTFQLLVNFVMDRFVKRTATSPACSPAKRKPLVSANVVMHFACQIKLVAHDVKDRINGSCPRLGLLNYSDT